MTVAIQNLYKLIGGYALARDLVGAPEVIGVESDLQRLYNAFFKTADWVRNRKA